MDISFLTQFIDNNKLGGWVRAGVAALIGLLIGKWPLLGTVLDPASQQALGVVVAGVVVGVWSQLTKTDSAKLAAVEALPDIAKIVVKPFATDGIAAAVDDPTRPKVAAATGKA